MVWRAHRHQTTTGGCSSWAEPQVQVGAALVLWWLSSSEGLGGVTPQLQRCQTASTLSSVQQKTHSGTWDMIVRDVLKGMEGKMQVCDWTF